MKANQQWLHDSARAVATLAHSQPIPGIYELLQNAQRTFIKMAESMQQDIDKLHKQIQKLNEFDRQTKNLFATSLEEMQLAMQGILVLNETTVKSNGLYTLPSGVDKSYFTEIKKDTKNEVTDKQLLEGCTIIRVHDRSRGFEYYMLEKDGYSYRIDEKKLSGNLAYLVKKYDLDVVELTPKELTTRANNQQKKGYNYFEKDDRVRGLGLLSKGQGVMDEIQESGLWDSLWMLGMGVASVRNAQTFSKKVSESKVPKVEIPEQSLKHSNVGDFTVNPSTGKVSKMKGGGHGQSNINYLKENGFEVNIEKTYPNGVRTGNVPDHKVKVKRTGNNQSWFPENWTNKDIENAGKHVASQQNFASAKDGEAVFGEFNGVRVGVIKTDGKPATVFPDGTKQP
ncbi:EndoU domain-containing protein [Enterococcus faecalis]|nr:EndoU domain-containing protein [Enterococcus faecalis]MDT2111417.1 EndoU domain-containing protein [Enterococcus faecalis]MDV7817623.1 EndoU domain-containing protein [Enterococcus faecalis]MEB5872550.1 EndoU domain-containing protein [Enterococcus faecalis]UER69273.1 EndoU domain-containing protein [Enterococcus faecalis]UER80022.1 EndoU domain-containing protein [Enterococcus faecalis]